MSNETRISGASIVIVEDERIIALDLKNRLAGLGYTVVATVASGKTAIDAAIAYNPDIILMDIHIEGQMDGAAAARIIHETLKTPIVFLTAYTEDETLMEALESMPFGYLVKPVDTRELHATIQAALLRAKSEKNLARSEQRLQIALDAAGMGIWEWEYLNDHFSTGGLFDSILGDAPNSMNESIESFINRLHEDDKKTARKALSDALTDNNSVNTCLRYNTKSGQVRWLEIHARISNSVDGNRLIGVVKDVTERVNMEVDLRQSAAVFETISEGLFVLSSEGIFTSANPAFTSLTGYTLDEIIGKSPEEFLHARRHSDNFYKKLVFEANGHWKGETWYRRKSGELFPVWESMRAITEKGGEISHYVASIADITPLRRAEEKINHLAYHDPLTGLPNRMLFNERLDHIISSNDRKNCLVAVMFIDLDGFKSINDTLGHSTGDLLLQTVASRLQVVLRSSDTVARLGGDEFVVIIDDLEKREVANILSQKLLHALIEPMEISGERVGISGSIGIAIYPHDGKDRQALMQAADTAMYNAKSLGKNQSCYYTPQLAAQVLKRMSLEQGLRQAVEEKAFTLHFQPQYRLCDGALTGLEALIRWPHPKRGNIPPDQFIPIAEECGLISEIGDWVLDTACKQVGEWIKSTGTPVRLAVNVSVRQLRQDGFLENLQKILFENGFPANLLEIEITETTLQILDDSKSILSKIRELGVSVAIDDFGTGYSSLSVLKYLPINSLKIDRTFMKDVPLNAQDSGIVEAIVSMGRTLGLNLIAEGVEREDQLEFLRQLECNEVQGYLLSRPMEWHELISSSFGISPLNAKESSR